MNTFGAVFGINLSYLHGLHIFAYLFFVLLKSRASVTFGLRQKPFQDFDKLRGKFRGNCWRYIKLSANGLHFVYLLCGVLYGAVFSPS